MAPAIRSRFPRPLIRIGRWANSRHPATPYARPPKSGNLTRATQPPGRTRRYIGKAAMVRIIRCLLALVALTLTPALAKAAEEVDLLLVLAVDVSRSVDHPKFLLQREGYAAAVSNPQVVEAIQSGPHGKIALCFVEWSGYGAQKVVIDWTMVDSADAARR